jgi:virulence-associated protein VagC
VLQYLPFEPVARDLEWKMLVVSGESHIIEPLNEEWYVFLLSDSQVHSLAFKQLLIPSL